MPKKNAKAQKSNELDGAEFFAAINLIEKEKGIPKAYMLEKITQALVSAYKRDHEGAGDNVTVEADEEAGTVRMFVKKDVVEEVDNPCTEMSLQMAREKLPHAQLGDVIRIEVRTRDFGRIAAQTARQVIIQGIREAEQGMMYDEFSSKEHEILTGVVTRVDPRSGAVSLRIGSGSEATEAFLAPGEQVKGEAYLEGMRLRVYVVEVRRSTKGPQVLISRTHPGLVKRLFELEVPEIYDGTVEVKSIAREAGSRTKLAVWSADPDVDPIGACVGPPGPAGQQHRGGAQGREGGYHQVVRGAGGVHCRRPVPRRCCQCGRPGRGQGLPCGGARRPALPGHRQGGTERPAGGQADGLEDRHQACVRPL